MNMHHIIITGASRGIGHATALLYASMGWNISICSRHCDYQMTQTQDAITAAGGQYFSFCGDMGNAADAEEFLTKAVQTFGTPEILVNNAGISYIGLLTDMSPDDWQRIVNTNLTSVFNSCRLAVPGMVHEHSGKIINISSVWGCCGASCEVAYSATKGGINAFTQALAKELAPSNIQVNAVACGAIDTEMNAFLSEADRIALTEEIPSGRFGRPEEVAELVLDLAQKHSYLTGQIIRLDGGWI